jgi:hypothetical protein
MQYLPPFRILHPLISPILSYPFYAENEADAILYFANVFSTMYILEWFFLGAQIRVEREKEETVKIDGVQEAKAFVDFMFSARLLTEEDDMEEEW